MRSKLQWRAMPWKRIQNDEKTRQQPNLLGHGQMKDLQELADQALRDLLKRAARSRNGHPLRRTALRSFRTYSGLYRFRIRRRIVGEQPVVTVEHTLLAPFDPDVTLGVLGIREPRAVEQLAVSLRGADSG